MVARDVTQARVAQEQLRENADELRRLAFKLTELQERERRELGRELHDRVGQNLTALGINLDILARGLPASAGPALRGRLQDSIDLVEQTAESIDDVMAELRPPMLDDYGLPAALRWYARQYAQRTGIAVEVAGPDPVRRLRLETELALFRIAQEALNNIAKHAPGARARITLDEDENRVRLTIADDGGGYAGGSADDDARGGSWGMITMRERAAAAGGCFAVESVPGTGTRVEVEVEVET
jgi:signal transduction histidine kinase